MEENNNIVFRERNRWGFLGLPFTFTVYTISNEELTIRQGLLNTRENDCYLYKIQDVTLKKTLFNRFFGIGTVVCFTSDNTDPSLELKNIKHSDEIKKYIFEASERERMKRRTVNTLNLNAMVDGSDIV